MKRILVCILLVVQSITFLNACGNENTNLNPNDTNVSEKNVEETAVPTSTPMKKYSMEDVIDFLQQKSREIDEKTDTITIEPTYNTISGYQYFLFNTSDVYAKNSNKSELNNLCVLPQYRHKHFGADLLEDAYLKARGKGCIKINISIVEENKVLRKWYEDNGFIHVSTKKFMI